MTVRRDIELRIRPGGDLAEIGEWVVKAVGLVLRVGGLLHVAAHPMDTPSGITAVRLRSAFETVVGYGVPHARAVLRGESGSATLDWARRVADWLAAAGKEHVTQRDVHRRFQTDFEVASDVAAVLSNLEEHGFLRRLPPAPRPNGAWSSPALKVNPASAG